MPQAATRLEVDDFLASKIKNATVWNGIHISVKNAFDIATGDESWIYCYDLKTKRHSKSFRQMLKSDGMLNKRSFPVFQYIESGPYAVSLKK